MPQTHNATADNHSFSSISIVKLSKLLHISFEHYLVFIDDFFLSHHLFLFRMNFSEIQTHLLLKNSQKEKKLKGWLQLWHLSEWSHKNAHQYRLKDKQWLSMIVWNYKTIKLYKHRKRHTLQSMRVCMRVLIRVLRIYAVCTMCGYDGDLNMIDWEWKSNEIYKCNL